MEAQLLRRARAVRSCDRRRPSATAAVWAGIAVSIMVLVVLLARGWGGDAWTVAAGVLLVICIGVCAYSAIVGKRSARAVDEAVAQLADARRSASSGELPDAAHPTPPARGAVDGGPSHARRR